MRRETLSKLAWFVGLWLAGVATIGLVAWMIKSAIM